LNISLFKAPVNFPQTMPGNDFLCVVWSGDSSLGDESTHVIRMDEVAIQPQGLFVARKYTAHSRDQPTRAQVRRSAERKCGKRESGAARYGIVALGPRLRGDERKIFTVMAGLVPAIHVLISDCQKKTWMPGIKPGMTMGEWRSRNPK
jgi:hypothetical protein